MKRKISVSLVIAIVLIAMTVTFSVTMIVAMRIFNTTVSDVYAKQVMYDKIAEIDKTVRDNYYKSIDDQTLYDMMSTGYIAGLGDTKSRYYTAAQYTELNDINSGKLMGVGIDLIKDTSGYFKIIRVYDESPAAAAGLVKDEIVTSLAGIDLKGKTQDAVNELLLGESGTTLEMVCLVSNTETPVTLQRSTYKIPTVETQKIDAVGYIRISTFGENTKSDLKAAIDTLTAAGVKSLVFDLRNNTGGELEYAADCIDLLCPYGTVASGKYADGSSKILYLSSSGEVDLPMVALTNENTAFGAELFAVSLRDFGKGKIVGTTTSGNGTVLKLYAMTDGSAVRLTVAELIPGASASFNGTGVVPDYESVLTAEEAANYYDLTSDTDPQIKRAVEVADSLAAGGAGSSSASSSSAESASESGAASETESQASSESPSSAG